MKVSHFSRGFESYVVGTIAERSGAQGPPTDMYEVFSKQDAGGNCGQSGSQSGAGQSDGKKDTFANAGKSNCIILKLF